MGKFYTDERNTQILISLLKSHGIKKVIVSPGATNVCLVGSLQQDSFFELYSVVDERSAAYMACGLAAETGEPVALSCTGATASRNYIPGLTEAFYRQLPVLAITSTQHIGRIGNHVPQVIDRTTTLNDMVKISVQIPTIHDEDDEWAYEVQINKALLELKRNGGGPVHINLTTTYSQDYSIKELPPVNVMERIYYGDKMPTLEGKIGIFVGSHKMWNYELTQAVENFCEKYNAVVLCDHTSNYKGKYSVLATLITSQTQYTASCSKIDILIHIGDVSGAHFYTSINHVWRVNPDGEIRDTFRKLKYTFEMKEIDFFRYYVDIKDDFISSCSYPKEWMDEYVKLLSKIPELPFSNAWIAQKTSTRIPKGSVIHFGILNSLRTWNFFEIPQSVLAYSNTGGFGIDGGLSSLLGASLGNSNKLYYGVIGDLAFFYDMNSIGNRHVGKNIRLLLVNNGRGTEFRNYNHLAANFGENADAYMAAAGHYGQQSLKLVKHYAEDLGFEYISASNKSQYLLNLDRFLDPDITDRPMLFEVFTDSQDESDALKIIHNLEISAVGAAKYAARNILGEKGVSKIKKILKK